MSSAPGSGKSPAGASWLVTTYVLTVIFRPSDSHAYPAPCSQTAVSGFQTIIDSGTTIIYGPPTQVATFYKSIPNSQLWDKKNGFYSFPCASIPSNVAFSWGGQSWTISTANFNFGRISSTRCIGAIAGKDLGLGSNVWLLGDR